jgi:hypothetical protein
MGGCAYVKIFGFAFKKQISHSATHKIGNVTVPMQPIQNLQGIRVNVLPGDVMFLPRDCLRNFG